MLEGLVIKAVNIWYHVHTAAGVLPCRPRGRLKLRREAAGGARGGGGARGDRGAEGPGGAGEGAPAVLVGDRVRCREAGDGTGVIEEVLPRRTVLARPPVANVDQVLVVFTDAPGGPDLELVDRVLAVAAHAGLAAVLALNKIDLAPPAARARLEGVAGVYRAAGYPCHLTSALTGEGVEGVAASLYGRVTVLAGRSGVGKSSLLNAVAPGLRLRTGAVGATGRGRHTTRHVELLRLPPLGPGARVEEETGWVADAPGFDRLDLAAIPKERLAACFPELAALAAGCRFRGCLHEREPGCAVAAAVRAGAVDAGRYARYATFLAEIRAREASRY